MNSILNTAPIKGRGTSENIDHRFAHRTIVQDPEFAECAPKPVTEVRSTTARSIISRNNSPDVGFNLSVNPYQGCEHGCVYCFARPTHAFHDLSPGLDFETRIMAKTNAAELLEKELSAKSYSCEPIAIGVNTDAYQPAERELEITRAILETCLGYRQPVVLITKSNLILRDLDILGEMAKLNLVRTSISITTLDDDLKRRMEPRASASASRLKTIRKLSEHAIPVSVMLAPVIPRINDHEIENILAASRENGASHASYVLLRLPLEVEPLFWNWLNMHYPQRANAVMRAIESCRGGKAYDATFYKRMRGEGLIARMIARRFRLAKKRCDMEKNSKALNTRMFRVPHDRQLDLF
ncbi:MAG TPA: PA0069 family radical SAM protein [Xanthomonadales bacterium]|nr:PA0069 family radical SAM protein [Xanthomonadales bacterium]